MKAIFDSPVAAGRLDRAESAGDAVWDCRTTVEEDEDGHADEGSERHERPVPAMATTLLLPRLFDQRLDEGLDLLAIERRAVASLRRVRGRTRRGGNGHACLQSNIELVLLVH